MQVQWEDVFSASNTPTGWERRHCTATNARSHLYLPWRRRQNTEVSEDASLCTFIWCLLKSSSEFFLNPSWYRFQPCGSTIKWTFWTCAVAGLLFQPWKFCHRSACVRTAGPLLLKDACCMCIFIPKTPSAHELVKGLSRRQEHGGGGDVAAQQPHPRRLWQSWIWIMLQYNMNLRDLCFHPAAQMSPR